MAYFKENKKQHQEGGQCTNFAALSHAAVYQLGPFWRLHSISSNTQ
jgi:hypothetical protein